VANSAGIPTETAGDKITLIRDSGPTVDVPVVPGGDVQTGGEGDEETQIPLLVWIALGAGILLLLLTTLLLLLRRKKKKAQQVVMAGDDFIDGDALSDLARGEEGLAIAEEGAGVNALPGAAEEEDEFAKNEEILNLRMQRSLRLKQNIAEFVDQNPQIAAKLVQSWLRGE